MSCTADVKNNNTPPPDEGNKANKVKPNIILMLVDDLGYSDFGCYGSEVETPNIDRIATNGIRFRTFYNNARSSPSRAALLTGLYPHQVGYGALDAVPGYPSYQAYANDKNVFIPEVIKDAGYFSVMTGKWHLGNQYGVTPVTRGFDQSINGSAGGFYFYNDPAINNGTALYLNDAKVSVNDPRLPANWYSTDMWVEEGLNMIDEAVNRGQPFFWYLAHNAPHFPLQAPAATIAKYKGKYSVGYDPIRNARFKRQQELGLFLPTDKLTPRNPSPENKKWENMTAAEREIADNRMAIYAAVIDEIDKSTGKVLAYLQEKGILDNTLIMILSDNGGNAETAFPGRYEGSNPGGVNSLVWLGAPWADVANTPFFLYKHHAHEGGCNTPMIISWPNGIDHNLNGTIIKYMFGHILDVMPTLVEITGAKYPAKRGNVDILPMEGISLVPCFSGRSPNRTKPIIMEHEGNKMIRDGNWKAVQEYKEPLWMLYDMDKDPTEMNDLATEYPDKLDELVSKYHTIATRIGVSEEIVFTVGKWYTPVADYLKD